MKKLSEVANFLEIKRQRIQEYEKAGIAIKPKVKDKHGYWLYGEAEIERLWQIKFYLTLNFTVPEIKAMFDDPHYNKHDAITDQIIKLEKQKKDLEELIEIARAYNEMDVLPFDIWVGMGGNLWKKIQYRTVVLFWAKEINLFVELMQQEDIAEEIVDNIILVYEPTEEAVCKLSDAIEKVAEYYVTQTDYRTHSVQNQVAILIGIASEIIPDLLPICWLFVYMVIYAYADGNKESCREESIQYIENAVEFYIQEQVRTTMDNIANIPFQKALDNLQNYGLKRYTTGSSEVQDEVRKLHQMLSQIGIFSEKTQIKLLTALSNLLGSQEAKIAFDNGKEKGISWFISRAIQIYCNHQKETMEQKEENDE